MPSVARKRPPPRSAEWNAISIARNGSAALRRFFCFRGCARVWPDSPLFLPALGLEALAAGAGFLIGRTRLSARWRAILASLCGTVAVLLFLGYAYALVQTGRA